MEEVKKLIEYSELAGFPLVPNGDKLTVENGTKLPYHLKQQIIIHKRDILEVLNEKEVNPL